MSTSAGSQGVVAVGRSLAPQLGKRAIHVIHGDRTTLDVNQAVRLTSEKSNHAILGVHGDAITIPVSKR